ncbi:DUF695 domain-containing protein [Myroides odoratimimus]|uniref:DUF695 domain-containing protein n=1 Tax=Myroides odoratimimus TaxID=76832 RepID=UPI002578DCE6|nr:DUF695 domain-containing protein [Myroides odoratimimus]MDM1510654.1 DUF695 domain-containing protein [Myroides odoratimimus]MDM1520656.1 DUF695 domain-containing protein [Myroides odoratimimus]MDM1527118.1 DUF695 domain-containing protein [Myroides odoratimimus]MDM1679656.1 DUF695 domain-containing protein [Myroides odoratimimus]MEC4036136.1 DUF695 domain-containing protein [Myroides odoratimimus]
MSDQSMSIRVLEVGGFKATGVINMSYANFSDKDKYPYAFVIELSLVETEREYPTWEENERLEEIENNIIDILRRTQSDIHYVGKMTRRGVRDIFCYLPSDDIDGEAIGAYCDTIEDTIDIHIEIEEDKDWEIVSKLIS